ncbi:MAG: sensor histidine kinase, partial [Acidobacteria bacterium]|nr:sensor histidine kinase [Acidobacteriota bacterium]
YQAAVFERFESRSQGSRHRGPGLGLALVKSIAELHGGSVSLKSIPGRGTTVRVLLPLRRSADAKAPEEDYRDVRASRAG